HQISKRVILVSALAIPILIFGAPAQPSLAQAQIDSGATTGDTTGHETDKTGQGQQGMGVNDSSATSKQNTNRPGIFTRPMALPKCGFGPVSKVFGGGDKLPATELGPLITGSREEITGGEGTTGIPVYFGFTREHRIEEGIHSDGLRAGFGSILPS